MHGNLVRTDMSKKYAIVICVVALGVATIAFQNSRSVFLSVRMPSPRPPQPSDIAEAAMNQIGKTVAYDASYATLSYPGGDVPIRTGVCADVVVRALRSARNMDLQKLVHDDMSRNFSAYPNRWSLTKPDRNIDHRRVPNLERYFARKGYSVLGSNFRSGDIVTVRLDRDRPHIMIVTNHGNEPWVVHNIGRGTQEENRLFEFKIVGHFRLPAKST